MPSFYDLDERARIALCVEAMGQKNTLMLRWENLEAENTVSWHARSALAAKLLSDCASVADLGCGGMTLETYLLPGTRYLPVDVTRRDERTLIADFNRQPPPSLEAEGVACLGLLEYLYDAESFLRQLRGHYRVAVVSYNPTDSIAPVPIRRSHAWVNDYSQSEFETAVANSGWTIMECHPISEGQLLWRLESPEFRAADAEEAALTGSQ